ncbi:MAG: heme ABC transporter permease [Rhodospirillaceae bacterium]|nr:heme ABC transporter permease [Rhodospirillaceae bacterium]|tara:strand:+ start:550 stop:1626 length:1077 start_codon:yes stop_codon:yes gene_type:complete
MADATLVTRVRTLRRSGQRELFLTSLSVLLAVVFVLSVGYGAVPIAPGQVLAILADKVGLSLPWTYDPAQALVLTGIRLPRAIGAVLVGTALAISGGALQGLFRNPLADPALIGVSTGAALAAATVIVFGGAFLSLTAGFGLPVAAFAGGVATTFVVYQIATRAGETDVSTMLLAGVALNAITAAGIGYFVFMSDEQQLRDLNYWLLGSLGGITWVQLATSLPFILLPAIALPLLARPLNAFLLGETEAGHLGFDVERTKRVIVVLVALAVGAAVAISGVIGFVGLVVPHLVRLMAGPDHRTVLPASALLGASLMLIADLLARSLVLPAELPIGILTSCVGGPFFLWLLMRRRGMGAW